MTYDITADLIKSAYGTLVPSTKIRPNYAAYDIPHYFTSLTQNKDIEGRRRGHYPYITYYAEGFVDRMRRALSFYTPESPHFIDVGCGIGDKLLFAQKLLGIQQVSGIEFCKESFDVAQQVVGEMATNLIHGDAFDLDFSPYNVIYMYCPIWRGDLMFQLFRHVAETAPEGALITEMLPRYFPTDGRTRSFKEFSSMPIFQNLAKKINEVVYGFYPSSYFKKQDGVLIELPK